MFRETLMACLIVLTHTATDKKPTIPAKHQFFPRFSAASGGSVSSSPPADESPYDVGSEKSA
jgi:hypothetical protein